MIRIPVVTAILLLCPTTAMSRPDQIIVIQGRREPSEAVVSAKAIKYLPFTVPAGVTKVSIHKELKQGPGSLHGTIDHGLFDPRGIGFGGPGFRGWMGGSTDDILIDGKLEDSRFFTGGPIQPGIWNLAQSYLMASTGGLDYKYTVTLSFSGPQPPKTMPRVPAYSPGVLNPEPDWYIGSLHNHTIHSDGGLSVTDLVRLHKEAGFEFAAITDHNTVRQHYDFAAAAKAHPDFLLIPGEEVTTPFGHANVIGSPLGAWFDFRYNAGDGSLPKIISKAHELGAIFSPNHPFAQCTSCEWRYPASEYAAADAMEVWNGAWDLTDTLALGLWDRNLKNGRHVIALGGADYHRGDDLLVPAAWVYAKNLSTAAIMDGMKKGHLVLTDGRYGPRAVLTARKGKVMGGDTIALAPGEPLDVSVRVVRGLLTGLRIVWDTGEAVLNADSDDCILSCKVPAGASYVRAELFRPDKSIASLTNPIYIKRKG